MYWSSERLSSQTGGWGEGIFSSLSLSYLISLSSFAPFPLSLFSIFNSLLLSFSSPSFAVSPPHPLSLSSLPISNYPHFSLLHPTSTYVCVHYKPVQQHGDPNQLAYETQVLVPQPFMGTIIGTAGSKIKELRSVSHSAWRSGLLHWDPILALCLVTCSKFSPCVMSHS
jgi:hypothetical protein